MTASHQQFGAADVQRLRWHVLTAFALFGLWWGGWGATVPAVQSSAGVNYGELGTALLFVAVGALLSMRFAGTLIDRFGSRVMPASIAVFGVVGVAPAVVSGVLGLSFALLAVGAASGAMDVAINTASAGYENTSRRPLMNLAHASFSLAVIAGGGVVGLLRSLGAGPLTVLGVLGGAQVIAAMWLFATAVQPSQPAARAGAAASWRWWSPPRTVAVLGVLTALAFMVENAWQSWSAVHLERSLSAAPGISALGPVVFGAAAASGRLTAHRLTARFTERVLIRAGAALAAVGTLVAAAAGVWWVVLAGIAAAGLGTASCAPLLLSLAGRGVDEQERGAVIGTVTTLAYLGFAASPAFVGLVARVTSLPVALGLIAIAAAALAAFAGFAHPAGTAPHVTRA
jgi:MFS family permease